MYLKYKEREMIIKINKTLSKSEREDFYEIINLLVNLDEEVKKKLLYMMLGMELLGATSERKNSDLQKEMQAQ